MDYVKAEKEASEILRSLLLRVPNTQVNQASYWPAETHYQVTQQPDSQETVLWSLQTGPVTNISEIGKTSLQPVTYVTTNQTIDRPITYVLSQVPDTDKSEQIVQNILLQSVTDDARSHEESYVVVDDTQTYTTDDITDNKIDLEDVRVVYNLPEAKVQQNILPETNETVRQDKKSDVSNADDSEDVDLDDDKPLILKKSNTKQKKRKPQHRRKPKAALEAKQFKVKRVKKPQTSVIPESIPEKTLDMLTKEKINPNELTKLEDNSSQVQERFRVGCECAENNCFDGLNAEKVFRHRLNIADLTKAEHDMYLMGVIMASMQNPEETVKHKERIRIRSSYVYQGKKVCLTAFLYLEHVTSYQLKRIRKHLRIHGVTPRIHGNHGRKPSNTLSLDIYQQATEFVQSYIQKNCVRHVQTFTTLSTKDGTAGKKAKKIKIPNRMASYHLPNECSKKTIHDEYKSHMEQFNYKAMKYSTFTTFLKRQFPNVKFHKADKKPEAGNSEHTETNTPTKKKSQPTESIQTQSGPVVHFLSENQLLVPEPNRYYTIHTVQNI